MTDSDEANLVACLMADMLSPATRTLARIRNAHYDQYHEAFKSAPPHINKVINPEIEVVKTIYRLMKIPAAVDMGELVEGRVKFVGLRLDNQSPMAGVRLKDFAIHVRADPTLDCCSCQGERAYYTPGRASSGGG